MTSGGPIAVTGATGFLGTPLLNKLTAQGWPVRALTRRPRAAQSGVEWVVGDVTDQHAVDRLVSGTRAVIHAAASLHGSDEQIHDSIVGGSVIVAGAAANFGARMIHLSSLAVIDPEYASAAVVLGDSAPRDPDPSARGAYSRAKIMAEAGVESAVAGGLDAVIVRPAQLVGDDLPAVPPSIAVAFGRWQLALARIDSEIALVHVEDVVDGLLLILTAAEPSGIVTLVDPVRLSRAELLRRMRCARVPGSERRVVPVGWLAQPLAAATTRLRPEHDGNLAGWAHRLASIEAGAAWECRNATRLGWLPKHLAGWRVMGVETTKP